LAKTSGATIQPVPNRGVAPAVADVISGRLASAMLPDGAFLPYLADRRARVIATTGTARSQSSPRFQQGVKDIVVVEWFGFFMPAGTPEPIVNRAATSIANALKQPDLFEAFAKAGVVSAPSTPAELARRLSTERSHWGPEVKSLGFNPLD
jgi:tripartite-type tricarboxylate transporter receptor subunit TctC